jgi:hypothetical protein
VTPPTDHGIAAAHERWCIYQSMDRWAREYGATSALEGPVDGISGARGVHCVGLARNGVKIVSAVSDAEAALVARRVYARAAPGASVDIQVVRDGAGADLSFLPASDLVFTYRALHLVRDWRDYLRALRQVAKKVLVVAVRNDESLSFLSQRIGAALGRPAIDSTKALAPVLWDLGHVREHSYLATSSWLETVIDPIRNAAAEAASLFPSLVLSRRTETLDVGHTAHAYGPDKWPFFGGDGWMEELEPALLRRTSLENGTARHRRWLARTHVFVVDVRPRTPQAKRKLLRVTQP